MRRTRQTFVVWTLMLGGLLTTLTLIQGQPTPPTAPTPPEKTAAPDSLPPDQRKPLDLTQLSGLPRQMAISGQRGMTWLTRMNKPDGLFQYGWLPALNVPMEGDHYLRQAGAAFALARASRFLEDERGAVRATQAVLTLLDQTVTDPGDPEVRHTMLPSVVINRLGGAGLLVLAINELPAPRKDLLEKSEQLCNFIRKQARPDGSLDYSDLAPSGNRAPEGEGVNYYPGEALYALVLSQKHRPAAWKTELVRKAVAYYHPWWQKNRNPAFIPWQTAAYSEAYLQTRDEAFARCVLEMNDWLCSLQYTQIDPRNPLWRGGFMSWADGKMLVAPPTIACASYAESLACACRVARQMGDEERYFRYRRALESCLQFLTSLQFNESNTQHFKEGYRDTLVGGFYASHQDGLLRIDYTQHAVSALIHYLEHVALGS